MKKLGRSIMLATVILAALVQQASAAGFGPTIAALLGHRTSSAILLGTTGDCNSLVRGGPCTETSTLVLLNPTTGALIKTIGPVGYTVNGLAWDRTALKLYATTAAGDTRFHGLLTINPFTGQGKPVNAAAVNFGLPGAPSPIHSITVDAFGHMVGWYDEFGPNITDTYVRLNQKTGVATEFPDTGLNTGRNGLSFGEFNLLWNIDGLVGEAYLLNPFDGEVLLTRSLSSATAAALGDFNPTDNLYYGLNFDNVDPADPTTFMVQVNTQNGDVVTIGQTVDNLHTIAFVP